MKTLVCGMPGTGKSTWVREHLGGGIAYDMDAIAAALRLRGPHEEYHDASRHIANDLFEGFAEHAAGYGVDVFIIRTAPDIATAEQIAPDRVVIALKQWAERSGRPGQMQKIMRLAVWAENNGIPIEYLQ